MDKPRKGPAQDSAEEKKAVLDDPARGKKKFHETSHETRGESLIHEIPAMNSFSITAQFRPSLPACLPSRR